MRRSVIVLFIVLSFTSGCAKKQNVGSQGGSGSVSPTTSADASASPTTGATNSPGASPAGSPSPRSTKSAIPTESPLATNIPGTKAAPLTATVSSTCVTPGGTQTLTVKSTAGFQLSYGTLYPDHSTHREYGSSGVVNSLPPGGIFTLTWAIPVTAPLGTARTDVATAGKVNGETEASFRHPYWLIATSC